MLTYAEGVLSAFAHDLQLRVERFVVDVDEASGTVSAELDPTSIRVVGAMRGDVVDPDALAARDVATIEATITTDVLETALHPAIRFHTTVPPTSAPGDGGLRVTGKLLLHGVTRTVTLHGARQGDRWVAETRLHKPDFGIRPYSAMLGTLRVAPDVVVRVAVPLA